MLKVFSFSVPTVDLTSIAPGDKILFCSFLALTLSSSLYSQLLPLQDSHFNYLLRLAVKMLQGHLLSTLLRFHQTSLIVRVVLIGIFCFCTERRERESKRARERERESTMFNIVKYDLSAPLPTFESSDKFQSMLGRIGLYYAQYTCSSPEPYPQNVCMENELLRRQNPSSSELILLANAYQRWVVKKYYFCSFFHP